MASEPKPSGNTFREPRREPEPGEAEQIFDELAQRVMRAKGPVAPRPGFSIRATSKREKPE